MGSVIKVSEQHMAKDSKNVSDELTNLKADIRRLSASMDELAACWEGPAWNTFQDSVNSSIEEMSEIISFIAGFLDELDEAKELYKRCETYNNKRLKNIRI